MCARGDFSHKWYPISFQYLLTTPQNPLNTSIMAQKAKKDRAKSNAATLNSLHIGSALINAIFLLVSLLFLRRSLVAYLVLSIPAFVCQYLLETTGRPKYLPDGKLRTSGEDLAAVGLTEYMFDVVWVTWASLVAVVIFGNWGWLLWAVVPVFGLWKGWGLFGAARGMMGQQGAGQAPQEQAPAMNRKQRRMAA